MSPLINVISLLLIYIFSYSVTQAQTSTLINGTIVIALVSNDTIWLGADTRTSALSAKGYSVNKNGMCKIYSKDNIVFAMTGHIRYTDNSFSFIEIMNDAIEQEDNFEKSMKWFEERSKKEINSILKKFSGKSINTLVKTNNGSFLTVMAVSFNNGEKQIKEMRFSIQRGKKNSWKVRYSETTNIGVGSLRFLGHSSNASKYVNENNLYFGNGSNIPDKLYGLIKIESAKDKTVGLPADVISIYNGGFKKIITSSMCD